MITPLTAKDSADVARIHRSELTGGFLPSLGFEFLKVFHEGIIGKPGVYGFGFFENKQLCGFVIGTIDSGKFFKEAIKARFLTLSLYLILQLIRRPLLAKNVLETFFYPAKDVGPKAELIVIAVKRKFQGRGIGRRLTESLEEAFRKEKIKTYKVTVNADKKAVHFYEHLGYRRVGQFCLYGKMWYIYARRIRFKYGNKTQKFHAITP